MYSKKVQIDADQVESHIDGITGGYDGVMNDEGIFSSEPYRGDTIDVLITPDPNPQGRHQAVVAGNEEETVKGYIADKGW